MNIKTTLLALTSVALLTLPAQAILSLTITSTVTYSSGTDTFGFDGSIWTLTYTTSQETYSDYQGFTISATMDSASLTVSGATDTDYNGTFAITETNTTNFIGLPNFGQMSLGVNTSAGASTFSFGPGLDSVSNFGLNGPAVSNPAVDDPIVPSDWQGASLGDSSFTVGAGNYSFASATLNASAVPEPATYAALAGLGVMALAGLRRWRKSKA